MLTAAFYHDMAARALEGAERHDAWGNHKHAEKRRDDARWYRQQIEYIERDAQDIAA